MTSTNLTRKNIDQARFWINYSDSPLRDFRNYVQSLDQDPVWIPSVVELLIINYQLGCVIFENDKILKEEIKNFKNNSINYFRGQHESV